MKKIIFSILLLAVAGVLFVSLRTEKAKMVNPIDASEGTASGARDFTRELLQLARKNDRKRFAELCSDITAKNLPANYHLMRRLKMNETEPWRVYTRNPDSNEYRVVVVGSSLEAYDCVLRLNQETKEWKFCSFEAY